MPRTPKIDDERRAALVRAERPLRIQVADKPPYNAPWSFFDLSEIRLYDGDKDEFLKYLKDGVKHSKAGWMLETFRSSLQLLVDGGTKLGGLKEGIEHLDKTIRKRAGN